jgi:hypothetical protein
MKQIIFTIIICFISMQNMNAQGTTKIKITIGTTSFVTTTYDNATAKAFIALLPMTVTMNELNGNEKYNYLSGNLPNSPVNPSTINNGDLMLYGSNCIVLFYKTFSTSYSYTQIGSIDNPTGLETALGSGNPTLKFELLTDPTAVEDVKQNNTKYSIKNGILQFNSEINKITLLDISGKVVLSSSSNTIDVKGMQSGIYIASISGLNQTKTIKIIIQK